jgi:helix-turn-helix protein
MKARGLVADDGGFTPAGRETKQRMEALTDDLAVAPYLILDTAEVDQLTAALKPLAAALVEAQD